MTLIRKGGIKLTKGEIVEAISKTAKISKATANESVKCFIDCITKSLKKKKSVTLVGFGTFSVSARKARKGRNPATGEEIKIKARKVPKFKPGKALKDAIK
ncbi:MAG: HU family DNA-binding protein [Nitrospinota bacterium]